MKFIKFILVSSFAAILNIASRFLFDIYFSYSLSIFLAFIIGLCTAFALNKKLVFHDSASKTYIEFWKFLFVNLISLCIIYAISMLLSIYILPVLGVSKYIDDIAHIIGVALAALGSYFVHKNYTFVNLKDTKHK